VTWLRLGCWGVALAAPMLLRPWMTKEDAEPEQRDSLAPQQQRLVPTRREFAAIMQLLRTMERKARWATTQKAKSHRLNAQMPKGCQAMAQQTKSHRVKPRMPQAR